MDGTWQNKEASKRNPPILVAAWACPPCFTVQERVTPAFGAGQTEDEPDQAGVTGHTFHAIPRIFVVRSPRAFKESQYFCSCNDAVDQANH